MNLLYYRSPVRFLTQPNPTLSLADPIKSNPENNRNRDSRLDSTHMLLKSVCVESGRESRLKLFSGLDLVGSVSEMVGLGRVKENGPTVGPTLRALELLKCYLWSARSSGEIPIKS